MTAEKKEKIQWIILIILCVICAAMIAALVFCIRQIRFLSTEQEYTRRNLLRLEEGEATAETSGNPDPFADITAPAEQSAADADPAVRSLYESQCQTVSYEQLNRGGNTLVRQYFTFTGKILQAMESSYRLGVGDSFSDVIYLEYVLPAGAERLLEDDYVTVWGQSLGLYTYTTVSDREITVPRLLVAYADRISEEEIAQKNTVHYETYPIGDTQTWSGCTVTLDQVLIRPADPDETGAVTPSADQVTVLFCLDCMNNSEEPVDFGRYQMSAWIDGYAEDFTYDYSDKPAGYQWLSYETLEPGHGIRCFVSLNADSDFSEIEIRLPEDEADSAAEFVFARPS